MTQMGHFKAEAEIAQGNISQQQKAVVAPSRQSSPYSVKSKRQMSL